MVYDKENVFAKILNGSIPCSKIEESDYTLSFFDISPRAPQHALVIPKGAYSSMSEFAASASAEEMADWVRALGRVAQQIGVASSGYRVIINNGAHASQEVPHLHAHIIGGAPLGGCFPE